MPAVMIRQLEALGKVMEYTTTAEQRVVLLHQADMILRSSAESVPEPDDQADVRQRYDALVETALRQETGPDRERVTSRSLVPPGARPEIPTTSPASSSDER